MKCRSCKEKITHVNCHVFNRYGGDDSIKVGIHGGGRWGCYCIAVAKSATMFEFDDSIDEFKDNISCPKCHRFPFGNGSVSIHEYASVIFGISDKNEFE